MPGQRRINCGDNAALSLIEDIDGQAGHADEVTQWPAGMRAKVFIPDFSSAAGSSSVRSPTASNCRRSFDQVMACRPLVAFSYSYQVARTSVSRVQRKPSRISKGVLLPGRPCLRSRAISFPAVLGLGDVEPRVYGVSTAGNRDAVVLVLAPALKMKRAQRART